MGPQAHGRAGHCKDKAVLGGLARNGSKRDTASNKAVSAREKRHTTFVRSTDTCGKHSGRLAPRDPQGHKDTGLSPAHLRNLWHKQPTAMKRGLSTTRTGAQPWRPRAGPAGSTSSRQHRPRGQLLRPPQSLRRRGGEGRDAGILLGLFLGIQCRVVGSVLPPSQRRRTWSKADQAGVPVSRTLGARGISARGCLKERAMGLGWGRRHPRGLEQRVHTGSGREGCPLSAVGHV